MADRRSFLKTSTAAAVSAAAIGCEPSDGTDAAAPSSTTPALDPAMVHALAETVLPGELGIEGRSAAGAAFTDWCGSYESVGELNHGYGTSEIRYLPEHPAPRWAAQLDALDREARKRFELGFVDLDADRRRTLVAAKLEGEGSSLGRPYAADHVAVGLLAHWAGSTPATDLCYSASVGKLTCRGLDELTAGPTALGSSDAGSLS